MLASFQHLTLASLAKARVAGETDLSNFSRYKNLAIFLRYHGKGKHNTIQNKLKQIMGAIHLLKTARDPPKQDDVMRGRLRHRTQDHTATMSAMEPSSSDVKNVLCRRAAVSNTPS